jgi:hypothetical protein
LAAPKGNLNAARNGGKMAARRLVIGELPKPLLGAKREARAYRRALEAAVLDEAGEISVTAAHSIDTAAAATAHAAICRWLLREKIGAMPTTDILACSKEIVRAKETRDRAVRELELDRKGRATNANAHIPLGKYANLSAEELLEARSMLARLTDGKLLGISVGAVRPNAAGAGSLEAASMPVTT